MSHTPGALRVGFPPPNGEQTIGTHGGLMIAVATTGAQIPPEKTLANARRLAACWNACEGLDTELLENILTLGDTLKTRFDALTSRQEELLDALQGLLQALPSATTHPAIKAARAAVAKATSKQEDAS